AAKFPLKLPVSLQFGSRYHSRSSDVLNGTPNPIRPQPLDRISKITISTTLSKIFVSKVRLGQGIYWNPSILRMPHYSGNTLLLIARSVTEGMHHKVVQCEAAWTERDILECQSPPRYIDIPASAAQMCTNKYLRGFS